MELLAMSDAVVVQVFAHIVTIVTILSTAALAYIDLKKKMLEIQKKGDQTSDNMEKLQHNTNAMKDELVEVTRIAGELTGAQHERERAKLVKAAGDAALVKAAKETTEALPPAEAVKNMDVEHLTVETFTDPNKKKG